MRPIFRKPAGTVKPSTALIFSGGNSYTSPVSELSTGAGKIAGKAFFSASTSITSVASAGVSELADFKDDPPPDAVAPLLEATSFWGFAPVLMRAQSLGIPSVLEGAWGPRGVWLGVLPEAKAPRDDFTMWWNRVDIVPNVSKCPVPG